MVDGGRVAARGFLYQYQRTVEEILARQSDANVYACRIEGQPQVGNEPGPDIVDFDLIDHDENVLLAAQVKSGVAGSRLGQTDVIRIFARLVSRVNADAYVIYTNTELSVKVTKIMDLIAAAQSEHQRREVLSREFAGKSVEDLVKSFTDTEIDRLGRCQVVQDRRSSDQLSTDLKRATVQARRLRGQPLGESSSGLLLAYLQSEVHRRAADENSAVWTITDFRETLSLDAKQLADLLTTRDWGSVLGLTAPIPDIDRVSMITSINEVLKPYREFDRMPRVCVLSGLSGIGKSSLAAGYLAASADAYSAIYWIDSTSADSVLSGYADIAFKLGITSAEIELSRLRSLVHERLSAQVGRWLIVFDDASSQLIRSHLPRIGDGDIIVTTIDSALNIRSAAVIEITPMLKVEATALIKARFGITELDPTERDHVESLVDALEGWPLALELACGYMLSCGFSISDASHYLSSLSLRSYGDVQSVPVGYPRTLVAAINLALQAIETNENDLIAEAANQIVVLASYLGARRVPVHLLIVARDSRFDDHPGGHGPMIVGDPAVMETVRALRRVSLARLDEQLPRGVDDLPTANATISMNTVLQDVVRANLESKFDRQRITALLNSLAIHLIVWFTSTSHNNEAERARIIVQHVASFARHASRLSLSSNKIAVLIGNLASYYAGVNRRTEALQILRSELQMLLNSPDPDEFLQNQARLHIALAYAHQENIPDASYEEIVSMLEPLVPYCYSIAFDPTQQRAAATFCAHSLGLLDEINRYRTFDMRGEGLQAAFRDLMSRLPAAPATDSYASLREVQRLMEMEDYDEVERICRPLLIETTYGSNAQLELQRCLIDALLYQRKWDACRTEIDLFAEKMGPSPLYMATAELSLHNVALSLSVFALLDPKGPGPGLFMHVINLPCYQAAIAQSQGEYYTKFQLFLLVDAILRKDLPKIESLRAELPALCQNEESIAQNSAWTALADIVFRFAAAVKI